MVRSRKLYCREFYLSIFQPLKDLVFQCFLLITIHKNSFDVSKNI